MYIEEEDRENLVALAKKVDMELWRLDQEFERKREPMKPKNNTRNDLKLLMNSYTERGKQWAQELAEFNNNLRKSDTFVETEDGFGVGYWRVPEGIWKAPKYKNGYHPEDGVLLDKEELHRLVDLLNMQGIALDSKE